MTETGAPDVKPADTQETMNVGKSMAGAKTTALDGVTEAIPAILRGEEMIDDQHMTNEREIGNGREIEIDTIGTVEETTA